MLGSLIAIEQYFKNTACWNADRECLISTYGYSSRIMQMWPYILCISVLGFSWKCTKWMYNQHNYWN